MRRTRLALVFTTALSAVTLVLGITPAQAAGVEYVALGDSYSSGVGSGSYVSSSGNCLRSTKAFSQLWASAHSPSAYKSVACSGGTTASVTSDQLSALTPSTTLVSISVGGNDVDFASVMQDCVLHGTDTCTAEVGAAETKARTVLPGRLDSLYSKIRARSPQARVVVLTYPLFYHTGVWYCVGLSETSRKKINEGAGVLDGVIATAAAAHGFALADVRSRFAAGHQICDGGASWLHNVDFDNLVQSYHPTASGQSGAYLPTFTAAA